MSVYTDIKLMVVSERKPYTADRSPIFAIKKGETELKSGEQSASSNAVKELIKRIKEDANHAFQLLWKPEEKYGTLFNALKGEKSKVTVSLYFFLREDGATGKVLWNGIATAGGVKIGNCTCNGKSTNSLEVVDITASSFA
jgi:hypothetical protein